MRISSNNIRNGYPNIVIRDKKKEKEIIEDEEEKQSNIEIDFESNFRQIVPLTSNAILYVIAVVSNPARFKRRYQLFNEFCDRMKYEQQIVLVTVELQQGSRPFATDATIKLRTDHELWFKENLINVAVRELPHDWEYMAWIDADIEFQNKNWVADTINQLQTFKIIQLFSHCVDLGVNNETLQVHTGFAYAYFNGEINSEPKKYGNYMHVGYAWAITKDAYNKLGGLMEFPILGSADNHMCHAFVGEVDLSLNKNLHPNYILLCDIFQQRCNRHIKKNIGFIHGTIMHHFHGNKADRKYQDRWNILVNNNFDPLVDIVKDCYGLWQLEDNKPKLRDDIIHYFRERNEDCNVMPMSYKYVKGSWI